MKIVKHKIVAVTPGSIGEEMDIQVGDQLISINNTPIEDIFDYHFLVNDESVEVEIEKVNGEVWALEIEKDMDEDLGLVFEESLMDCYKSCTNKCVFCFIDQLPQGMRDTLYFKDDDSRLSFLQGNYITMTNMKQEDIDRIIKYHLSPINISIHTANIELRKAMLKNRFAGKVFRYMDQLFDAGIEMNGQIVLCKGINDGVELNYTLDYLKKYIPHLSSLSIVPVGVSAHREGLTLLEPFTKEENNTIIAEVEKFRKNYLEKFQTRFVHLADEFYLNSDYPVPKDEAYEDYLQLENGVGMTRLFSDEFSKALRGKNNVRAKTISVVTGMLFYPTLRELVAKFNKKYPGTIVNVYPIQNDFFGHNITVTGLLTGRDIINQLNDKPLGEKLFLPKNLLKRDEPILLDDMSVEDMRRILNIAIEVVDVNGAELFARFKE